MSDLSLKQASKILLRAVLLQVRCCWYTTVHACCVTVWRCEFHASVITLRTPGKLIRLHVVLKVKQKPLWQQLSRH